MTMINLKNYDLKVEKRITSILAIKLTQKNPKSPQTHLRHNLSKIKKTPVTINPTPKMSIPLFLLIQY